MTPDHTAPTTLAPVTEPSVQDTDDRVATAPHSARIPMPLQFTGSAREYFRIWIVNLCLTLFTLGIFSAWAKVRKKRYFYSHMLLDGTPFQYLGKPIPILKGRVIAAVLFAIYYFSSHFFRGMLPYVLAPALLLAPWILLRSAGFNSRYSAYRNIRFDFVSDYTVAAKAVFSWGVAPLFACTLVIDGLAHTKLIGIIFLAFGALFPLWMRNIRNFVVSNTRYGGRSAQFSVTGFTYWVTYFLAALIALVPTIATVVIMGRVLAAHPNMAGQLQWVSLPIMYCEYALAYAFVQARITNAVWTHTQIGSIRFASTLPVPGMIKLYFSNALAILASGGLMIPWAVIRTLKYRADHMTVERETDLSEFVGGPVSTVHAIGVETLDLFDLDVSL